MNANEYLVEGSIPMTRGSILRVEDGRDLTLYVWEGAVWLTQEGDLRDRYVGPGEWFRLDRDGVAVAHATQRTVMSVTAPIPELFRSEEHTSELQSQSNLVCRLLLEKKK